MPIKIAENDYSGCLYNLSLVFGAQIKLESATGEAIVRELKKLPKWKDVVSVVETTMMLGKSKVRDGLYYTIHTKVSDIVDTKEEENDHVAKVRYIPEWERANHNVVKLNNDIIEEIKLWCTIRPPLKFKNIYVKIMSGTIYDFMFSRNPKIPGTDHYWKDFDLSLWNNLGKPASWCILIDAYMEGYYQEYEKEQKTMDGSLIESYQRNFLINLMNARLIQMKQRVGANEKKQTEDSNRAMR